MTFVRRRGPLPAGAVASGRVAGVGSELARLAPLSLVVATALYLTCMVVIRRPDGAEVGWLDLWYHNGLRVAAGAVALGGAARAGFDRPGWWVVGSALSVNALANIVWVVVFHSATLSLADPLFLAYYPQMYVAVIILARRRAATRGAGQWLDGAVAGLGVAAVVAAFVFPTLLSGASGSALAVAVNISYPLADLLLVAVLLAGLAPVGWRPDRALAALIGGLLVTTVADVVYLLQSAADSYTPSSLANHFWISGYVITALAGWLTPRQVQPRSALSLGSGLLLPAASAITAAVLLVIGTRHSVLGVAVALAAATLSAAGIRVGVAFADLKIAGREPAGGPNRRADPAAQPAGLPGAGRAVAGVADRGSHLHRPAGRPRRLQGGQRHPRPPRRRRPAGLAGPGAPALCGPATAWPASGVTSSPSSWATPTWWRGRRRPGACGRRWGRRSRWPTWPSPWGPASG